MTREQRQQVKRRQDKIQTRHENSVSSRREGPSEPKGKGIDPREWGNAHLSEEDLDLDAQAAALNSFGRKKDTELEISKERYSRRKKRSVSSNGARRSRNQQAR